jgi:transketolase
MPVCIVGNGGGYGYGIMGATHHALEDIACLSVLPNMTCWIPAFQEDVEYCLRKILQLNKPSYLRLGLGKPYPNKIEISDINKIVDKENPKVTIVALGPIIHNVLNAIIDIDNVTLFTILTIPFINQPLELIENIKYTKKLIVVEEHSERGGLGEFLLMYLMKNEIYLENITCLNAKGYPNKLYGTQAYHQNISCLDELSIKNAVIKLL